MDLTISYHPVTTEQMKAWYFDTFEDLGHIESLDFKFPPEQLAKFSKEELETFYKEKYLNIIKRARELDYDDFNRWHGYFIAVTQGFFETFYFTHGSAFSNIADAWLVENYITPWQDCVSKEYIEGLRVSNAIVGPFSVGAYLSPSQVKTLLSDYKNDSQVKALLEEEFDGEKINVFIQALEYAQKNDQGIVEASSVIDPGEEIFDEPQCYSNVFNCDIISGVVYSNALAKKYEAIYKGLGE